MLYSTEELKGLELAARDGPVGTVRDVYFDDDRWVLRYLVVRTGGWLAGREVLISPHAVERLDRETSRLHLALTRQQIERAPPIDSDQPVSRQHETSVHDYYGYPYYWTGTRLWGALAYPAPMLEPLPAAAVDPVAAEVAAREDEARERADPHLRSSGEVSGYALHATDGTIGRIEDFLFDDRSFAIECVVVDSRPWWPGGEVVLPRSVFGPVDWAAREVALRTSRQAVKDAPAWNHELAARDDSARRVQLHFERSI